MSLVDSEVAGLSARPMLGFMSMVSCNCANSYWVGAIGIDGNFGLGGMTQNLQGRPVLV